MIRSMPPASAHLALSPVPAPPPMIGRPAATWARRRCRHCSRLNGLMGSHSSECNRRSHGRNTDETRIKKEEKRNECGSRQAFSPSFSFLFLYPCFIRVSSVAPVFLHFEYSR